ncbi:MAG: NUDIX domain-containing protein [Thermodesulfovibrionales bacterium]
MVDDQGNVCGLAPRSVLHADPSLLHSVVHVLVFNNKGELLLQRRALTKDVAPGLWDTSVGGHVEPGEELLHAARRETSEELGMRTVPELEFLYRYRYNGERESELVHTFRCVSEGPFEFSADEILELRFWQIADIEERLGTGAFSGHFAAEFARYLERTRL